MEADWMKQISNESICNFFYVFFVIYAFIAVLSVVSLVGVFTFMKVPKGLLVAHGVQALISMSIATTMMLFLYLICDRALNPKKEKKE
jgi:hypothetical protein